MSNQNKLLKLKNYSHAAALAFSFKAPANYCRSINFDNRHDPLLSQILPTAAELKKARGFSEDPLAETFCSPIPGLLHKYSGRVLLLLTDKCAINCRFCFRKFQRQQFNFLDWQKILNYIKTDRTIKEVILSGGDPLMLAVDRLQKIIFDLGKIPHLKILRIHSRIPIVCPQLVTRNLLRALTVTKLAVVIVTHCNHPLELTTKVSKTINMLRLAKITVLNQSVLLKGINDKAEILIELSEKLFAAGILPYYLHFLDKVQGAQHFAVNRQQAKKIQRKLLEKLPGYLVPKLVYEKNGARYKMPI